MMMMMMILHVLFFPKKMMKVFERQSPWVLFVLLFRLSNRVSVPLIPVTQIQQQQLVVVVDIVMKAFTQY